MINFERRFSGQLVAIRPQSITDKETGEEVSYFEVDVVATDSQTGERFVANLTCGDRAFVQKEPSEFKGGEKVEFVVTPKRQGKFGIGAKLIRIDPK